jgi:hypothetical protein
VQLQPVDIVNIGISPATNFSTLSGLAGGGHKRLYRIIDFKRQLTGREVQTWFPFANMVYKNETKLLLRPRVKSTVFYCFLLFLASRNVAVFILFVVVLHNKTNPLN